MKVIGISTRQQTFSPGQVIPLLITVEWGLVDTGGIITVSRRSAGSSVWQTVSTVNVGNPGLGIPNLGMAGKTQTIQVAISAPQDTGYFQIGAKEQSEPEITVDGGLEIQVVPETPTPTSNTGIVQVKTNVEDTGDTLLYIDGTPTAPLPAQGYYATLSAGKHTISAKGSVLKSPEVTVVVFPGSTQGITLPLSTSGGFDWTIVGALVGVGAGLGVAYLVLSSGGD